MNKQKEVSLLYNDLNVGSIGLLETKIKLNRSNVITGSMFHGWRAYVNHKSHYNGRICIVLRDDIYDVLIGKKMLKAVNL